MSKTCIRQWALLMTWLIALVCLLATLYASEILNYPVCHLCWFQRISIYPLVIIIGIAAFRNDGDAAIYGIPLASLGGLFALYQYLQQMIPGFAPIGLCGNGPSCSNIHLQLLGFITFPLLALVACVLMIVLLAIAKRSD